MKSLAIYAALVACSGVNALSLVKRDKPAVIGFPLGKRATKPSARRLARRGVVESDPHLIGLEGYYLDLTLGTPPQKLSVDIDTGSSDFWVPAANNTYCKENDCTVNGVYDIGKSSTAKIANPPIFVNISYGTGREGIAGPVYEDTLTVSNAKLKINVTLAEYEQLAVSRSEISGIIGLGPNEAEQVDGNIRYPSLPFALTTAGYINSPAFSLWMNDIDTGKGQILFGGVDKAKYEGELVTYNMLVNPYETYLDYYVVVNGVSVTNGSKLLQPTTSEGPTSPVPALVDSGAPFTLLPQEYVFFVAHALGAKRGPGAAFSLPCSLRSSPITINYHLQGLTIKVPISEYIVPNHILNPDSGYDNYDQAGNLLCRLTMAASNVKDANLGAAFNHAAYVVYDLQNKEISIAPAKYKVKGSDIREIAKGSNGRDSVPGVSAHISQNPSGTAVATSAPTAATSPFQTYNATTGPVATATSSSPGIGIGIGISLAGLDISVALAKRTSTPESSSAATLSFSLFTNPVFVLLTIFWTTFVAAV